MSPLLLLRGKLEFRQVNAALKQYADYGGLWGMLDPEEAKKQGRSAAHFLTGNGTRTVIMTMSHRCVITLNPKP
jgi:hypothetical protein